MRNALGAMALLWIAAPAVASEKEPTQIELDADAPVEAIVEGGPAKLQIATGLVDRLTLTTDYVAARGIKPAAIMGKANLNFWGRKEVQGRNRPLGYSVAGRQEKGRAFWFMAVPQPKYDGSIGPWKVI